MRIPQLIKAPPIPALKPQGGKGGREMRAPPPPSAKGSRQNWDRDYDALASELTGAALLNESLSFSLSFSLFFSFFLSLSLSLFLSLFVFYLLCFICFLSLSLSVSFCVCVCVRALVCFWAVHTGTVLVAFGACSA